MAERRMALSAGAALILVLAALASATVAGYFGTASWMLEVPAHFRPQLAAVGVGCALLAVLMRRRWLAGAALALAFGNLAPVLPYAGLGHEASAAVPTDLKVLTLNLQGRLTEPARFHRLLADETPDIVLLTELPSRSELARLVGDLGRSYPYQLLNSRHHSARDVLILSRWRPEKWVFDRSASGRPVMSADLCAGESEVCVRVVGLHTPHPFSEGRDIRDQQFAAAVRLAKDGPQLPTVLMGDLNITPWAPSFARLLADSGLADASGEHRFSATWQSRSLLFGLPLDQILTSPGITVLDSHVAMDVGSDHFPVVARLALRPGP